MIARPRVRLVFTIACSGLALTAALRPVPAFGEVTRFEITTRKAVSASRAFASSGPYEEIAGRLYFAVDPNHPRNRSIVDLDKAPRNASGRVEFSADVVIYRPRDPGIGNGIALVDVVNRGNRTVIGSFNHPGTAADREAGDGFLFNRGYTLVCIGWEFDVPLRDGAIRIDAPVASGVSGIARGTFTPAANAREFTVADLEGYKPTDPGAAANTLTVRDGPLGTPTVIERGRWRLAGNTVTLDGGFEAGRLYELAYAAKDPVVAGLGFLAVRDAAAWIKHDASGLPRARQAVAFGSSQSGRFLRSFLYEGFNPDEQHRQVFDGVMAHIAGSARIDLNRRWATPTTQATYTATSFPFADMRQKDPATGAEDGALDNSRAREHLPKLFYTNTAVEYWGGGRVAALVHGDPQGTSDLVLPAHERVYFIAGTQHGPAVFPPKESNGQLADNPTDYWWAMRALLVAMERWVRDGTLPPDSRYPRFSDGTLVAVKELAFPQIPHVPSPRGLSAGGRAANRLVAADGKPGAPLPLYVPQVDADGNERAGIRLPDVAVPLATLTGWNFRKPSIGVPDQLFPLLGSSIPFTSTKGERTREKDPRLSIEERYADRETYLRLVNAAAAALVNEGYLLAEDVPGIARRSADHWNLRAGGTADNQSASPAPAWKAEPARFTDPNRAAKLGAAFGEIDKMMEAFANAAHVPGAAWGIVVDGSLAHAGATGYRDLAAKAAVQPDTVFRIASMTKSFTALAILKLRDDGKLSLDDPAERYVPELKGLAYPSDDSPRITIRHLLSHAEGFPEDNPWGDQQLGVSEDRFTEMLRRGIPFSNTPGVAYEYSNYGFAILGRVVSRVSGMPYRAFVEQNILRPLGLTSTTLEPSSVPPSRLARGYRWEDGIWKDEPLLPDGAFGSMGGMLTSIPDLARYVGAFLSAWPPRDGADTGPILRSSLREMQQVWRPRPAGVTRDSAGALQLNAGGYGFALAISQTCAFGHIVSHGGGLPGFGSLMRWLPEYGVGIVTFGNATYTGWNRVVNDAFGALAKSGGLEPRVVQPSTALVAARDAVSRLIVRWDDGVAKSIAAENFFLDRTAERRRADFDALHAAVGACTPSGGFERIENALRGQWIVNCERGRLRATITLAPTVPPSVQYLDVTAVSANEPPRAGACVQ